MGITFHRNPKERRWFEKILRRFIFSPHPPKAMRWGSWTRREKKLRKFFPVRFFIWVSVPDFFRYKVSKFFRNIKEWIRYRTVDQYHIIRLEIKPGYYDPDTQLLEANFQILKDFVEIELAAWNPDEEGDEPVHKSFKKRFRFMRRMQVREPENGIGHLDWEINNTTGPQRDHAIEKKELYDWWVNIRPFRAEPMTYDLIWEDKKTDMDDLFSSRKEFELSENLSQFYIAEDTAMLHRLINVRCSMWT